MSLEMHIVRKDILRLRWPIAGWLLGMAAKYAVGFYLVLAADSPENSWSWGELRTACMVLVGLETALTFLIAVFVIQGDSVLGTRSAWMTRPISGARLLRAKLGGMAALLVAPAVLLPVPWWLVCGFGLGDMTAAMAAIAAWQVVTIGIALVAAVVADSLGRVIVWTLVTLAVLAPTIAAGVSVWVRSPSSLGPLAALGILVMTSIAVVVLQFLTRERRLATGVLGLGLISVLGLRFMEEANYGAIGTLVEAPPRVTGNEWNKEMARDMVFEFRQVTRRPAMKTSGNARPDFLFMTFAARGIPDGYVVGGATLKHEWFGQSGLEHEATGRTYGEQSRTFNTAGIRALLEIPPWATDPETDRWRREQALERRLRPGETQSVRDIAKLLRERRLAQPAAIQSDEQQVVAYAPLPSVAVERVREAPTRYSVAASLDLVRPERWLEIPLAPGSWTAGNARGVRLLHSKPFTDFPSGHRRFRYQVALIETERAGFLAMGLDWLGRVVNPLPQSRYAVVNRTHATLEEPSIRRSVDTLTLGGVTLRLLNFDVAIPRVIRNGEWTDVTPDWQADAKLALLGWRRAATIYREIQVENFELPPDPRAPRE